MALDLSLFVGMVVLSCVVAARYLPSSSSTAPFPPGPKGRALWGNLFDMPSEYEYIHFREWSKKHGKALEN